MIQAEIITIGDELLIGQVVDTNSAWMAQRLNEWGIVLKQITSVHDDREHIVSAISEAFSRADVVLLTGGLGPTKDDITKNVLCDYFHTKLIYRSDIREHLESLYQNRPEILNRLTDTQCLFPEKAELISNKVGSAQVMLFRQGDQLLISMPGVPYEMMWVMNHGVGDVLRSIASTENIIHHTVQCYGISESGLAILIENWEDNLPTNMHLAYLPKDGIIRLRLSGYGTTEKAMQDELSELYAILDACEVDVGRLPQEVAQGIAFAKEDLPIEVLLGNLLKSRGLTIASAESCTGGKIAHLLNKHAGSSAFYYGSVVAYDNSVKETVLGVSSEDLTRYGAVSEPVVRQMAEGVRSLMHTDYAVATSGVAGPDGGTPEKPVGTVWAALATPEKTYAFCFHLGKLREQITDRAAQVSLLWLYKLINLQ